MQTIPNGPFAAVLGSPIAHSLSPVLHRAAYHVLGIDWSYEKFELVESELKTFLDGLSSDCRGLSLTMPLKFAAYSIAEIHDAASAVTRVCNTLIWREGSWHGFNTDVPGFVNAFSRVGVTSVEAATVLGAGATSTSAIAALAELGAGKIDVVARRPEQIAALKNLFPQVEIRGLSFEDDWQGSPILVSTLPAGAADEIRIPAAVEVLFDVIYSPWPTMFSKGAEGRIVLGGLDLLVSQAVEQVFLMADVAEDLRPQVLEAMYVAGLAEQVRRSA